jgi:hypothetical protein
MAQYNGVTNAYDPNSPAYSGMPLDLQYSPFMPGQREALAAQLAAAYGGGVESMFDAVGKGHEGPVRALNMSEPLSQTMAAWGLEFDGTPGGARVIPGKTFNPSGFQQWGTATGQPYIDTMFGLRYMPGEKIPADARNYRPPAPAPAPAPAAVVKEAENYAHRTNDFEDRYGRYA